ncbi:DUF2628 domain-containing protein [Candidatus Magnetaquicoccus inordinatus]|uniref:DUF2628 domain-containing protein n=1 Tax=Candidatus Magnetaquicoccus inordinatus TaxID=2496818 RepID=UPI00102B6C28
MRFMTSVWRQKGTRRNDSRRVIMKFQNSVNGYEETRSVPWLWALLFGPLYFMAIGRWSSAFFWIIVAVIMGFLLGPLAMPGWIILDLWYAIFAGSIVRRSYLSRGWYEI